MAWYGIVWNRKANHGRGWNIMEHIEIVWNRIDQEWDTIQYDGME